MYDQKRYSVCGHLKTLLGYSSFSISSYVLEIVQYVQSTLHKYAKMRFANTIVHTKLLKRTETRRQGAEGAAVAEFSASF